jgi:hypothetical protein
MAFLTKAAAAADQVSASGAERPTVQLDKVQEFKNVRVTLNGDVSAEVRIDGSFRTVTFDTQYAAGFVRSENKQLQNLGAEVARQAAENATQLQQAQRAAPVAPPHPSQDSAAAAAGILRDAAPSDGAPPSAA